MEINIYFLSFSHTIFSFSTKTTKDWSLVVALIAKGLG